MQSTLAPVPARLGVIPARASPWECSCMERIWVRWQGAGVSLWPCPVCPHWLLGSQTSPGWVQEQRDLECALQSQPPAGIGFPVRPAKGHCSFLSPLTTAGPFTCSWTWKGKLNLPGRAVWGRGGSQRKENLLAEAHLPQQGQGPWACICQSAEPGFHTALSCVSANYNSLFF